MIKKLTAISLICLLFLTVSGCALLNSFGLDTPEKKVLAARESFNLMLRQYKDAKDQFDIETQAKIKTYFETAAKALDAWDIGLTMGLYTNADREEFIDQKNLIIDEIGEVMGWNQ